MSAPVVWPRFQIHPEACPHNERAYDAAAEWCERCGLELRCDGTVTFAVCRDCGTGVACYVADLADELAAGLAERECRCCGAAELVAVVL